MINTIFYFAETLQEYEDKLQTEGISEKTIVFVKDTNDIYINQCNYNKNKTVAIHENEYKQLVQDHAVRNDICYVVYDT